MTLILEHCAEQNCTIIIQGERLDTGMSLYVLQILGTIDIILSFYSYMQFQALYERGSEVLPRKVGHH